MCHWDLKCSSVVDHLPRMYKALGFIPSTTKNICIYIYMCTCVKAYVSVWLFLCMFMCLYVCVYMHICIHASMCACVWLCNVYVYESVCE